MKKEKENWLENIAALAAVILIFSPCLIPLLILILLIILIIKFI